MARSSSRKTSEVVGVTGLSVSGYKSIETEQHIAVAPLTVLAGTNSSGKSSIMQPLLLLKQTLEAPYDPGALLLDGPNVRLTSAEQALNALGAREFSVSIYVQGRLDLQLTFEGEKGRGFAVSKMVQIEGDQRFTLKPGLSSREIETMLPPHSVAFLGELENAVGYPATLEIRRSRCFLEPVPSAGGSTYYSLFKRPRAGPLISDLIHVPGLRGNPERTYRKTSLGTSFPGRFENYIASILHQWQSDKADEIERVRKTLSDLALTSTIGTKEVDDTRVEIQVGRLPSQRATRRSGLVSIADVGFGVSQLLPVLVALEKAAAGRLVYIEQPELHLHPKAQLDLAPVLARAALRGVRVVVETHSALLIRGIQTEIALGKIPASDVQLHWFERNDRTGSTTVRTAEIGDDGSFGDWPADFDEVALFADRRYLDVLTRRRASA